MEYNTIKVLIIEGRNLKASDRNWQGKKTSSDPYVKLCMDGHPGTFKTKTVYKNLNPVWNETIEIAWPASKPLEDISLEVFDKDIGSKDDQLGGLVISAADIQRVDGQSFAELVETHKKWVPVSGGGGGLLVCAMLSSAPSEPGHIYVPPGAHLEAEIEVTPSDGMPVRFHVKDKWAYLSNIAPQPVVPTNEAPDAAQVQRVVGYKCVNYRGAIAHGKRSEWAFLWSNVCNCSYKKAEDLFIGYKQFGGSKSMGSIKEIKQEIMESGPVVSSSFLLTENVLAKGDNKSHFSTPLVGQAHAVLIVGWKQSSWLVRSFKDNTDIKVEMGQSNIDLNVVAPISDLSNVVWQDPSKVYEPEGGMPCDWYSWTGMDTRAKDHTKLVELAKAVGGSLSKALFEKTHFVIRDPNKIARSRYAYLTNIEWVEEKNHWLIQTTFDDQWER